MASIDTMRASLGHGLDSTSSIQPAIARPWM